MTGYHTLVWTPCHAHIECMGVQGALSAVAVQAGQDGKVNIQQGVVWAGAWRGGEHLLSLSLSVVVAVCMMCVCHMHVSVCFTCERHLQRILYQAQCW